MKLGPYSLVSACVRLALCVSGCFLVVGFLSYLKAGVEGLIAAAVAATVCWAAATAALLITGWLRDSPRATYGMLLASVPRLGVPLVAGAGLNRLGGRLADAGVFGWIVVFYLLTLIIETLLSLSLERKGTQASS